jgi:tripartite-type tricarboxylate transporter receptor subunit TctC
VDTELKTDADSEMVVLTYKDNEALDASIVKEIEKAKEKAKDIGILGELVASLWLG